MVAKRAAVTAKFLETFMAGDPATPYNENLL
jgi:hypothetical protein